MDLPKIMHVVSWRRRGGGGGGGGYMGELEGPWCNWRIHRVHRGY